MVRKPVWYYLVVAGILIFLLDIALRQFGWLPGRKEEERIDAASRSDEVSGPVDLAAAVASRSQAARRGP